MDNSSTIKLRNISSHIRLSCTQCLQTENEYMKRVPHFNARGYYDMVYNKLDITYILSVINMFMTNPENYH